MRLTLRTLLAYLDNVGFTNADGKVEYLLDPTEEAELEKKINESELATALVHRIRGAISNPRLSSPRLIGKGMGVDANSTSEFLDSTLPLDRVAEFEQVCLESDVHLAEAAACHQILAIVLGKKADFSEELRQRVYALRVDAGQATKISDFVPPTPTEHQAQQVPIDGPAGASLRADYPPAAPVVETSDSHRAWKQPVPDDDFLERPSAGRMWPLFLALLLGFLGTMILLRYSSSAGDALVAQPQNAVPPVETPALIGDQPDSAAIPIGPALPSPILEAPANLTPQQPLESQATDIVVAESNESPMTEHTPELGAENLMEPEPGVGGSVDPAPAAPVGPIPVPQVVEREPLIDLPSMPSRDSDFPVQPINVPSEAPAATGIAGPDGVNPELPDRPPIRIADADIGRAGIGGTRRTEVGNPEATNVDAGAAAIQDVGRTIDADDQVIAYWDAGDEIFLRMPGRASLRTGTRYAVLPTFRPKVLFKNSLHAMFVGRANFQVMAPQADDSPVLQLERGRLLVSPNGDDPVGLCLALPQRRVVLRIEDPKTEVAIEVANRANIVGGPETALDAARATRVRIAVLSGRIAVADRVDKNDGSPIEEGQPELVKAGEQWTGMAYTPPMIQQLRKAPLWTTEDGLRSIDREARMELESDLATGRPLSLSLLELNQKQRADLKSLSARCLAVSGEFGPLVATLADKGQHPHWEKHFNDLRQAVQHSPAESAAVRDTLARRMGGDAEVLFEMIWGYTPAQLEDGSAAALVTRLGSDSLPVRVLAIENLKYITGKWLMYRADRSKSQRMSAIRNWQNRLKAGEIAYPENP